MVIINTNKRAAWLLFLFLTLNFLSACSESPLPDFKFSGSTMGTSYHITVVTTADKPISVIDQQQLQQAIDQQLTLINQQMSTYIADSELSQLNQAPVGEWVTVSPNLFEVLMLSLELGWLSNGAFDISVGPLVDLWGFGPSQDGNALTTKVPEQADIDKLLAASGFQQLELNLAVNKVRKLKPLSLDLSAVAKGYAVDKLADLLSFAGYENFMVEIGGELRLHGHNAKGKAWRIAIEQPNTHALGLVHQALNLSGVALATSGDYRNYFERDGQRYSHTIDPTTGYPIKHRLASVTVVADTAAYADGLATAINVLGAEQGMQLAKQQNLAVYLIIKTDSGFESRYSEGFGKYLVR